MAETSSVTPGPKEPSPFDRLAARVQLPPVWLGRISNLALLAAVSLACAFVISPALSSQQIPVLEEADLGKPYQAPSAAGFKAGRDYEIVDSASTESRRQDARTAVKPVYDYKPGVLTELKRTVRDAFDPLQEIVAAASAQAPIPNEPPLGKKKKTAVEPVPTEPPVVDQLKAHRKAFEQALFGTEQGLEDEDFTALANARFSEEVERATLILLDRAYVTPVATAREELAREAARG